MMLLFSRMAFFFALLIAAREVVAADSAVRLCPHRNSANYYFPKGEFRSINANLDQFVREWYSNHLKAMSESSLSCGQFGENEIYRFTWLRTFHHPIAIRITHTSEQTILEAVELSGAGGYKPGQIFRRTKKQLSSSQWEDLLSAIYKATFWNVSASEPSGGLDGARWVFEGRRGLIYRVVDRWSPDDGEFRRLGLTFLDLAQWSVPDKELY